ncbi:hypothetical protein D3C78_1907910 [compost metagenome]
MQLFRGIQSVLVRVAQQSPETARVQQHAMQLDPVTQLVLPDMNHLVHEPVLVLILLGV